MRILLKFAKKHGMKRILALTLAVLVLATGCAGRHGQADGRTEDGQVLYRIDSTERGYRISVLDTDGSIQDTLTVSGNMDRIVCMSSSYAACLSAIGSTGAICGISGVKYISDTAVCRLAGEGRIAEVGSDAMPDYERIAALKPDIVVAYRMPGSDMVQNLKSLGIRVLQLNDYLENSPLGRASYIRIFGVLTARLAAADSVFGAVSARYRQLADKVNADVSVKKVLMNIPYADAWYVPGGDNYMSRLVEDAGGRILGSMPGQTESSIISTEKAFTLSREADLWLNTGWCDTMEQLYGSNAMFKSFGIRNVFNNTLRVNGSGGNDFWESGAVHPDWILHDLLLIMHPELVSGDGEALHYYRKLM